MNNECIFLHDNNVKILLPDHHFSDQYKTRVFAEIIFRKITTYLILNDIIKHNIIDLGSWMADNTIPWAKNIGNRIVYAIDPSPENCAFTKIMMDLNKLSNVSIIEKAISDKNEQLTTNDHINHCSFFYQNVGLTGKTKITSCSLDYLYNENIIDNVDYIHLDVEGMEFKVILGANNIINKFRPIIAFEQHLDEDNYIELSDYLKSMNYDVYLINEILPGCRPDCKNLIGFPYEKMGNNLINNIHNYLEKNDVLIKL